jgi:hypothetical protein
MSQASTQEQGQCLCGAVRFSAHVAKREIGVCHCSMCRRWSGGVFMGVECEDVSVENENALGIYSSSEWGERCFCKTCGSTLFWRSKDGSHTAVSVQAFENPASFSLVSQIYIDEKPDCYSFSQATQNMTGAEFIAMITSAEQKHD